MKLHKRILRLHHFRNLGKDLPTELLLNADFDGIKHGGLVILVGENNVGKSNVLEGLKYFNNDNNFLCPIEDYEKQAQERTALSLIKEVYNNDNNQQQIEKLSWVELKENQANKQAFEMSFYPFENHIEIYKASDKDVGIYLTSHSPKNFENDFIQSIREALEVLLPCVSNSQYTRLKHNWGRFLKAYKDILQLNEKQLEKKEFIVPDDHKGEAKRAYKNLKKALLLHICLTFKEYSLSKLIERFDKIEVCEILEKMRKKSEEQINKIAILQQQFYASSPKNLKANPMQKAILANHLPQIINCENPFELKDENLRLDIKKETLRNRIWETMCFEWCETAPIFTNTIINMKNDNNFSNYDFKIDKEEQKLQIDEYWPFFIELKNEITENAMDILRKSNSSRILEKSKGKTQGLEYVLQMSSKIDKKYNTTFTFYDLEDNFLFDKKTNLLYELKKELKKMGEKISKEFNESYCINPNDEYRYIFEFRLKKQHFLHIRIKRDNEYLELAKQSTGFQWFFNLFFNFLYPFKYHKNGINRELGKNSSYRNYNSIVVMDEPATHLSVPARQEFRERLRRYGKKRGITFVLATHDPFLVDTNHLDEIRIVEKQKNGSVIYNEFNYPLNDVRKDSDALDKIKRSLGVEQHIFHNPRKHQIIFVEGITDYCYLSAFKLYFNERYPQYKDNPIPFTFLPISGLKREIKDEDEDKLREMKETIKKLCELDNNPIVLIDDDRKNGVDPQKANSEKFKKANAERGNPIKILQLSQCNENFKQIEYLFSDEDQQKYSLKNKNRELAIAFKSKLYIVSHKLNNKHYPYPLNNQDIISKQTEINFLYLFEWIACNLSSVKN
ncbi:OLD family protein [Helicobacter cetorum]|uniref:Uncharacterized protein n=1 Tax=Helicobacter cetorum (strain ATCC BAA-540 / CCUG 52418 / MIT 99-5656) TaxID=1163745 RepID=I0ERE9_HELCM|nr:ABC transporter ATP-binding protein [Helicobacter cetorum]AFI05518.1 hypothetical protein HCD_02490 [Helicobacter cetorum MIT 99-5656]